MRRRTPTRDRTAVRSRSRCARGVHGALRGPLRGAGSDCCAAGSVSSAACSQARSHASDTEMREDARTVAAALRLFAGAPRHLPDAEHSPSLACRLFADMLRSGPGVDRGGGHRSTGPQRGKCPTAADPTATARPTTRRATRRGRRPASRQADVDPDPVARGAVSAVPRTLVSTACCHSMTLVLRLGDSTVVIRGMQCCHRTDAATCTVT